MLRSVAEHAVDRRDPCDRCPRVGELFDRRRTVGCSSVDHDLHGIGDIGHDEHAHHSSFDQHRSDTVDLDGHDCGNDDRGS